MSNFQTRNYFVWCRSLWRWYVAHISAQKSMIDRLMGAMTISNGPVPCLSEEKRDPAQWAGSSSYLCIKMLHKERNSYKWPWHKIMALKKVKGHGGVWLNCCVFKSDSGSINPLKLLVLQNRCDSTFNVPNQLYGWKWLFLKVACWNPSFLWREKNSGDFESIHAFTVDN